MPLGDADYRLHCSAGSFVSQCWAVFQLPCCRQLPNAQFTRPLTDLPRRRDPEPVLPGGGQSPPRTIHHNPIPGTANPVQGSVGRGTRTGPRLLRPLEAAGKTLTASQQAVVPGQAGRDRVISEPALFRPFR